MINEKIPLLGCMFSSSLITLQALASEAHKTSPRAHNFFQSTQSEGDTQ
jgi:hypothetical protein